VSAPDPAGDRFEGVAPGLSAERTDLAWSRSGLALMACGVAIAKGLPALHGNVSQPIAGIVLLVMGGAVWLLGWAAARRRRHELGQQRLRASYRDVAPIAFGTAAVGAAGLVLVLFQST